MRDEIVDVVFLFYKGGLSVCCDSGRKCGSVYAMLLWAFIPKCFRNAGKAAPCWTGQHWPTLYKHTVQQEPDDYTCHSPIHSSGTVHMPLCSTAMNRAFCVVMMLICTYFAHCHWRPAPDTCTDSYNIKGKNPLWCSLGVLQTTRVVQNREDLLYYRLICATVLPNCAVSSLWRKRLSSHGRDTRACDQAWGIH